MYPMDIQMKSAGFRLRVEPELRQAFIDACKASDLSAAQVLRSFMKSYIGEASIGMQGNLFVGEEPSNYASDKDSPGKKEKT